MADTVSLLFQKPHLSHVTHTKIDCNTALQETHERKPRKSVAFSEGTTIVDENGEITMKEDGHDDTKDTAMSHSPSTPPLSAALGAFTDPFQGDAADEPNDDDDVANMLKGMKKKKKSKTPKAEDVEEGGEIAVDDGGLDLSSMKKKKKSKKPKETEDEFAAKLAALEIEGNEGEGEDAPTAAPNIDEGDMEKGTGIWQHDSKTQVPYELLLSRFFTLLAQKNPDHASSGSRSYKIPPPQCLREGNKKTIFANIAEICKRMKRTDEHVTSYLFAELGTSGSVDGSRRLVIKGRFQQKQIENVLRRYISKFMIPRLYKTRN
jgi:translation initiation factor 2 subunit 2